ncbi:MAG TPA: carboxypeptidase-like regulatory domain-containing protein [Candidatus Acidoferrales bacterium]|nr:carboxypeptidase-like regulatory domain-containing protein [Candidatus Acidoferrales bacterium]
MRLFLKSCAFLFLILLLTGPAQAQGSRHDDTVRGEQGIPVAGATIVVCTQPANVTVTPCTPLANLFTDATLTVPAPNPLTSDGLGNFHFYAAPGMYTVQVYGAGIQTYTTPDVILPMNPANAQVGSLTATNAISALTLSLGGNLNVGGNANVTGTLTAGSLAASFSPASNAALKPFTGDAELWVSPSGSDANDGKSKGTAMATIDHALCSLPAGNCATNTAGNGTIYYFDGSAASATAGCGIALMGPIDPNYSSPPPCWMKVQSGGDAIAIIGIGASSHGPSGQMPRALIVAGSSADRNHPGIWLSGTNAAIYFANMAIQYPGRGVVIGECSNNTRTGTCNTSPPFFYNVTANVNSAAGDGPTWDITGASFWVRMIDCGGNGTDNVNPPLGDLTPAVLIDGRTNAGVGLVDIYDFESNNGGIKVYAGTNVAEVNVRDFTSEGQAGGEPAVWFAAAGSPGDNNINATIDSVEVADATATTPGVEVDVSGLNIQANHIQGNGINIIGPVHTDTQYLNNLGNQTVSPAQYDQVGTVNGWLLGKRDDVQRNFGLAPVRFPNIAATGPAGWTASGFAGTTTFTQSGILAPDGTLNAAQASNTSNSTFETLDFYQQNHALAVGDYIVAGAWVRSATANGYFGSTTTALQISVGGTGNALSGGCNGNAVMGDGEWTWDSCIYKVVGAATSPATLSFFAPFDLTYTIQAYAPVMNYIPAGTISANEVTAYRNALKTYDSSCATGNVCGLRGVSVQGSAFETLSANPAQSGIFRLGDTDTIAWRNHANSGDVTLSKNASDQLVAPPLASPTFFAPIVDSASGPSGLTYRNSGTTVWTTNVSASALSWNFNAHLGETTLKLTPFGGQSYAGVVDNYGMTAGFVAVTESGGTMAFDAGLGNTFEVTLNANVSTTNLINAQAGQWLHFIVCEPSSGGPFTFNWPGSVRGGMTVGTTAGKCSAQSFVFDGTSAFATSGGVANQ